MYRELGHFIVLIEEGSVTRAAARLGLTQPALTKSLRRLEDHLGFQLVERGPRGVELTEEGRSVFSHAKRVDAEMRHLELDARAVGLNRRKSLRIGASPSWSVGCVPELVQRLAATDMDLSVSVHVDLEARLVRLLADGEIDIALCNTDIDPGDSRVTGDALVHVEVRLAGRIGHPLLGAPLGDLSGVFACDWIDYHDALDQPAWGGGDIRSRVRGKIVKTSSWLNALLIAARTDGLLPLPTNVSHFLPAVGLTFIDGVSPLATFNAGIWRRDSFAMTKTGRAISIIARELMRSVHRTDTSFSRP
ncbi:DNA-binding transcriptional LysR family regulator [Rhizobium sp. SG_E_25_P2]|uniref:LysR family transcriptional regulator n=1 Tax=Rhizobium sp. SG_E_25_P2 TaxID=2879942 RepID=UPI00247306F8|nr:LysR family transcriptional regulator [Rhizobium sp. SG_E_25_P2]MDH6269728.1 DNA-binding transcriptional LysR family regulator [Rhizobium sp. SG_E_25_P2]